MKSHVGCSQNSRLIAIIIHGATLETIIFCFVILLVSYVTCVENNSCAISCVISPLCLVLHFFGTFFWCSLLCLFLQKPYPFFPQPFFFGLIYLLKSEFHRPNMKLTFINFHVAWNIIAWGCFDVKISQTAVNYSANMFVLFDWEGVCR